MTQVACDYIVARYVAHPLRDEAKNIGVILRAPRARYLGVLFEPDLKKRLGGEIDDTDLEILREYVAEFETALHLFHAKTPSLWSDADFFSERFLEELYQKFQGKLQFTRPRGAVAADPDEELARVFDVFVRPEKTRETRYLEKESLVSRVAEEFERRQLRERIGTKYAVKVQSQQLIFSYGYRRFRGAQHEVVVEAVDLTGETFAQRVRALAPTSVKFEIAKSHRRSLETLCLIQLPALDSKSNGEFGLELETLRRHADGIFNFDNDRQRERFLRKVEGDLRI